ncbi:MAG: hypothetical protein ACFCD0_14495 [Gemmataceae bacterium]
MPEVAAGNTALVCFAAYTPRQKYSVRQSEHHCCDHQEIRREGRQTNTKTRSVDKPARKNCKAGGEFSRFFLLALVGSGLEDSSPDAFGAFAAGWFAPGSEFLGA